MSLNNIAVAYCRDNKSVADSIENQLSAVTGSFTRYEGTKSTSETPLGESLLQHSGPILLIISDNFLKSAQCMASSLKLLQQKKDSILPIVIDGVTTDEKTGEVIAVPTEFDRVSDIIQYINYWQDQYLDLRRQKRHLDDYDEEKFNAHLKVMRSISSEAGEFLRLLRSTNFVSYEGFASNHFERFFKFTNDFSAWEEFKKANPVPPSTEAPITRSEPEITIEEPTAEVNISTPEEMQEETIVPEQPEEGLQDGSDVPEEEITEEKPEEMEWEIGNQSSSDDSSEEEEEEAEEQVSELIRSISVEEEEKQEEEQDIEEDTEPQLETVSEEEGEDDDDSDKEIAHPESQEPPAEELSTIIEKSVVYLQSGQSEMGLDLLAQAAEKYPLSAKIRYQYSMALAQHSDNIDAATEQLEKSLELDAENEDALFLMGEFAEIEEDYSKARESYEKVLELKPKYPEAHYRLGALISGEFEGEMKLAAKHFKKAAKNDPDNADAYYQYAMILKEDLDKPKKARKYFKKAIDANENHPFALYDLALLYHQEGAYKKARKYYLKAVVINPELKTPENENAFSLPKPEPAMDSGIHSSQSTIEALKSNISQLEELLKEREEEQETEEEEEPAPVVPKVDKTVLITGATSGIGRATAELFAESGYRLILNGRRKERLENMKDHFEEAFDSDIILMPADVRDNTAIQNAVGQLEGKWQNIDILINNAGKAKGFDPIHEGNLDHWEEMIDTNIKGLLYLTRAVAPLMVNNKKGHIINICSTAGKEVYPNGNVYCATKHAVDALTKAMRLDLHKYDIRISQVSPAHVEETEFALVRFDGNEEKAKIYEDFQPLTSTDVAESIFFIASRPAHVNIQDIVLMGTQQATSMVINRSGRDVFEEEEE